MSTSDDRDKLRCDDCGNPANVVVSELITREVDILCWQCLMTRALAVAAQLAEREQEGSSVD